MTTAVTDSAQVSAGEVPARTWPLPVVAVTVTMAMLGYLQVAELDTIEVRLVALDRITEATVSHIWLTVVSTVMVTALMIPLGVLLTRRWARWLAPPFLAVTNAGQAIPSIGILVLLALVWTIGFWPAVVALVAYAALPVLRNTMVGIQQVDAAILDAGRGMGMSPRQLLWRIELPLAVPIMMAGIRIALVLNVGVATLATFTNAGGLGDLIEDGISVNRTPVILAGCVLTIALALMIDWIAGLAEKRFSPRGL